MQPIRSRVRGFTLIEMIMVIVITGIIAGTVAVAIRTPVASYLATIRRAELSDEADTSLRFITRELKAALPNSIRCDSASSPRRLEFLPIRSGGRYREYPKGDGTGAPFQFGESTFASFDLIGAGEASTATTETAIGAATTGTVVVGNLSQDSSNACSAYFEDNASPLVSINGVSGIVNVNTKTFSDSCNMATATLVDDAATASRNEENNRGAGRFFVVGEPIMYTCGSNGLLRYSGYTASAAGISPIPAGPATLAGRVTACELVCDRSSARVQTVSLLLTVTESNESLQLFRQIRVENLP